ncbi:MAG: VWA domain-containing protein, partial [Planctomycetes bacterium]|nr:VWA domain-containing protein [Planctomycetota bacterium]
MSFLYPLFLLGALGIAAPIILHMIRRQTQKQQVFSSLMFLKETRPRYQKRSKIEHWLLLMLRCAVLILVALAFMRPFLENPIEATPADSLNRKVILVDTSASMRREGIWPEVLARVDRVLAGVEVDDRVSVIMFDRQPRTLIDFEQWQLLEPDQRVLIVGEQIKELTPSWQGTALDQALIAAVRMIEEDEINTQNQTVGDQQIVLISDLQQGAELDLLHTFNWPGGIYLRAETVTAEKRTNGSLTVLADQNVYAAPGEKSQRLVRVSNSSDALQERFVVQWDNNPSESEADTMDVYVPPGQSVVVNIPYADESPQHLQLAGDDNPFDNQHYVSAPVRHQLHILYLGDEDIED